MRDAAWVRPASAYTSISAMRFSASAGTSSRSATATSSTCTEHHRREPVRSAHAHLPGAALHDGRALGRLQPDEHIPGLHVAGEANFSDHGANRLGASALMQGLADGYFILPLTIGTTSRAAGSPTGRHDHPAFRARGARAGSARSEQAAVNGRRPSRVPPRAGPLMWDYCGMARSEDGLKRGAAADPRACGRVLGERARARQRGHAEPVARAAGRVADFLEFAELMCYDALDRDESCGGHFRVEHQTEEGEARRNDDDFAHVSVWEYTGAGNAPRKHREELLSKTSSSHSELHVRAAARSSAATSSRGRHR
jgi:succinate dehydrogenase/fumarate reductase flavoprotein subunit